jgi:hypothetical protein
MRLEAAVAGGHLAAPEESAFGRIIVMEGRPVWRGASL